MRSLIDIFSKRVKECVDAAPVILRGDEKVTKLAQRLSSSKSSVGLVVTEDHRLIGIVTAQDLIESIDRQVGLDSTVADIMTSPVRYVHTDDYLYHAIRHMSRYGVQNLPVVDAGQRPLGTVSLSGILSATTKTVTDYARFGLGADEIANLKQVKDAQVNFVEHLLSEGMSGPDTQIILSLVNRYIHRQLLDNALIGVIEDGWGQLPIPFAAVVMGSSGRRESFLNPDQDNGFILADYPDEKHSGIDPFFIELAKRFTTDLDRIGIPLCHGYIMATNPAWRKTSTQWRQQLSYWKRHPNLTIVRQADIFFDFEPFFGEESLSLELKRHVMKFAQLSPGFLRDMHSEESSQLGVALSLFGRLRRERDDLGHEGTINLKYGALLPLTQSVRLLALREGLEQSSTLERISRLTHLDKIDATESHKLISAYSSLSEILLRQQVLDSRHGKSPSYYVPVKRLSRWEIDEVVLSLRSIANFRDRVDEELTGRV